MNKLNKKWLGVALLGLTLGVLVGVVMMMLGAGEAIEMQSVTNEALSVLP